MRREPDGGVLLQEFAVVQTQTALDAGLAVRLRQAGDDPSSGARQRERLHRREHVDHDGGGVPPVTRSLDVLGALDRGENRDGLSPI